MGQDLTNILPQMIMAGGGFLIFCAGAFRRSRSSGPLFYLALFASVAAGVAVMTLGPAGSSFGEFLDLGAYARYFMVLISFIAFLTLLFTRHYARVRGFAGDELYGLILFSAVGMYFVVTAAHWLIFFLGFEILSVSLYVLIAINKKQPLSGEAGLKYLILGAVSGAFLVFGIALLYAMTGTLAIHKTLAPATSDIPGVLLGLSFILAGIAFKISLAPFHLWTADVYQGAPAPVTGFLAAGSKVAVFAALTRFSLFIAEPVWVYCIPVLWIIAVFTMAAGNIAAVAQTRVKRLLAYSSVAQMGYLFMTLIAVRHGGPQAIVFYLAVYALMDLGAFGIIGSLSEENGDLDDLQDFEGLAYASPWRAAVLSACLFSLAGLPPMAGFVGKFMLFMAVLKSNYVILAVIGIVTAIVSTYYYLKVIVALFMRPRREHRIEASAGWSAGLACAVILVSLIALGLAPSPLLTIIGNMVLGP